jgi:hypothetical protein
LSNINLDPDSALSIDVDGTMKTVHSSLLNAWALHTRTSTAETAESTESKSAALSLVSDTMVQEKLLFIQTEFTNILSDTIASGTANQFGYFKILVGWSLHLDSRFAIEMITNGANSLRYLLITEDCLGVEIIYNLLSSCIVSIFQKTSFQAILDDLDSQKPTTSRLRLAESEINRYLSSAIHVVRNLSSGNSITTL